MPIVSIMMMDSEETWKPSNPACRVTLLAK